MINDLKVREFEAESVAWLICGRVGIEPHSAKYLNVHLCEGGQIPQISLETVIKASGKIESMMKNSLALRK